MPKAASFKKPLDIHLRLTMKILKIIAGVVVALGLVLAIVAPVGPMPGLFIGGTATAVPTSWPDTSDLHEIKLKVPGVLPRVVIIWVVDFEGELYVLGMKDSGWTGMIGAGSPVEVRIGDETYAVRATPVVEGGEEIYTAYLAKYEPNYPDLVASFPSIEEGRETAVIFRLGRGAAR